MNEPDMYTHCSRKTALSRRSKKRSYLEDLSPFMDEEARQNYNNSKNSFNTSKRKIGKFMNDSNVDDFGYTKDDEDYSDRILDTFTNIDKYQQEEDMTELYKDSENVSPNIQNSSMIYDIHPDQRRVLGTMVSDATSNANSSKFKPYRPSFANLHGYSEKLKEINNILNSDHGKVIQNSSNVSRNPSGVRMAWKRKSGKIENKENEFGGEMGSTPKLSSRRSKIEEEDSQEYSRTIRNVPKRELGETRRSKIPSFQKSPVKNAPVINSDRLNQFQDENEKLRVFRKIKGGDDIGGSIISSYGQTINEDTLLEPDDYSQFLSSKQSCFVTPLKNDEEEYKTPVKIHDMRNKMKQDGFKILSQFQKYDMSGSILKDFSKDFGRKENPYQIGHKSRDPGSCDSKLPTQESSYQRPSLREEIRVTDLEEHNTKAKNFEIKEKSLSNEDNEEIREEKDQTEFIGDTTLMELQ